MRLVLFRESSEPILPDHLPEMSFFMFLNDRMYIKRFTVSPRLIINSLFTVPITHKFENKQCIINQFIVLKPHFPESAQPGSPGTSASTKELFVQLLERNKTKRFPAHYIYEHHRGF